MADTQLSLRGLVLSASELRQMTNWPQALVEDYLNILNNLVILANTIDDIGAKKLEELETDFNNGSIPVVESGKVVQDTGLIFDILNNTLFVGGDILGKNRVKQFYFSGF